MSVLNPFFRQQVQNPGGISTSPEPIVDDFSDRMRLNNAIIDEQIKGIGLSIEAYASFVNAKAQIKEEENNITLKKTGIDISQDISIMLDGFSNNKDFTIGKVDVKRGEKEFHSYTGFDDTKKKIESDITTRLQTKYNPDNDKRLNELIKLQVKGSLIDAFYKADNIIRKNISDMSLAEIEEKAISNLNQFKQNDFSSVVKHDSFIDSKLKSGGISEVKAIEAKISWRKKAYTKIVKSLNSIDATPEDKEQYLKFFNETIDFIENPPKEVYDTDGNKTIDKNTNKRQFFKYISIADLQEINRSFGQSAYTPEKNRQKFQLDEQFRIKPYDAIRKFGAQVTFIRDKETGQPTGIRIKPLNSTPITKRLIGGGNAFIKRNKISLKKLLELNPSKEKELRDHFEDNKPIDQMDLIVKSFDKDDWHKSIKKELNNQNLDRLDPLDVIKVMNAQETDLLTEAKANHSKSTYDELTAEISEDLRVWMGQWNSIYDVNPATGIYSRRKSAQTPEIPYLNKRSSVGDGWKSKDPKMVQVKNNLIAIHGQLLEMDKVLESISKNQVVSFEQIRETEGRIKDIQSNIDNAPTLDNEANKFQRERAQSLIKTVLVNRWNTYKTKMLDIKGGGRAAMCSKIVHYRLRKKFDLKDVKTNTLVLRCQQGESLD
jgi:hypothetical protein